MNERTILISQYQAALEMLKQAILACPEALWHNTDDQNKFSQVAYHALYWTHMNLQESEQAFHPWSGHREEYRLGGGDAGASGDPATQEIVLEYLAFCQDQVAERISTMDFDAAVGFDWLSFTKFEHQLYSMRHVQQHVGELMERLGARAGIELDWVDAGRPS
jgi:hypothetical protein